MGVLVLFTIRDSPTDVGVGSIHQEVSYKNGTRKDLSNSVNSSHQKGSKTNFPVETIHAEECESIEDFETQENPVRKDKSTPKHSWYSVFTIPNLWVISGVYAILYLLSNCLLNWSQLYFVQEVGMTETSAAKCYSMFQVGAMMGNLVSGYVSDCLVTPVSCPELLVMYIGLVEEKLGRLG